MVMNKENDGIKRGNDLISRQAAIEEVETRLKAAYAWFNDGVHSAKADGTISTFIECVMMLKGLPAAEPEIIRCKECKHSEHWYGRKCRCFLWSETGIDVFEDGFCNCAERRTDDLQ